MLHNTGNNIGKIVLIQFRSLNIFPVVKLHSVIDRNSLGEIGSCVTVDFLFIIGEIVFSKLSNEAPPIVENSCNCLVHFQVLKRFS